jgi:hypothetical protein
MIATNKVESAEKTATTITLEAINSLFESPSIRFCFKVRLLYSFEIIETITTAKKSLKKAAIKLLKCQISGKLKIP